MGALPGRGRTQTERAEPERTSVSRAPPKRSRSRDECLPKGADENRAREDERGPKRNRGETRVSQTQPTRTESENASAGRTQSKRSRMEPEIRRVTRRSSCSRQVSLTCLRLHPRAVSHSFLSGTLDLRGGRPRPGPETQATKKWERRMKSKEHRPPTLTTEKVNRPSSKCA